MPDSVLVKEPASTVTGKASAAITGARFVNVSGNRTGGGPGGGLSTDLQNVVQVAQVVVAGGAAIGVSAGDMASGSLGMIRLGGICTVEAGAALVAGQAVMSDALGRAVAFAAGTYDPTLTTTANLPVAHRLGVVMTGATGAGAAAEVLLQMN